ncbi:glycosyltransferase family 39 protein [Candidatus Parabeggiatoa sp. HSG14]|uniref:glycosyltransferase family 39 protein n=1 Tax=Candidatus Parabeggiatoa sp. HSG14 TaxID=3055593 RepID=UPI0025A7638E|nr:glycosyltransferase family 39 protein [Thiotrichales bacterium HSG14]
MKNTASIPLSHKAVEGVKYLFLASLATVFLVELVLSLHWQLQYDSAFLHYVAYLINEHGFVPYRDIFEVNMPGTYLFHIAIGRLFGYSDFASRMVDVAWLTATLTVTWFIMKPFGRVVASASCLLFGLIYLGFGPSTSLQRDAIAILPIATALLLATRRSPNHSVNLIHFLLGVLFALVALIKPHLAIGLPALIVYKCMHDTSKSKSVKTLIKPCIIGGLFALVGFLLTLTIPFLWLWRIGALQPFWDIFSSYVPLYLQMSGDFQFRETLDRVIYALRLYLKFGEFDILLMSSMFGVYIVLTKSMSAVTKKRAILLLSLVILYSLSAAIGGKLWAYHWIPFVYFTCLCTAMVLFSSPSFKSLHRPFILLLLVFIVTVMMTVRPAKLAVQQVVYGQQPALMDGRVDEIATYLNEHLSPTDKVQPLEWIGGAVHAMLISETIVATPYLTDFQFYHHVSNPYIQKLRKNFMTKLKGEMPTFIIEVYETSRVSGLDTTDKFPELKEFIKQHYKQDYTGDGFDIFRREER